LQDEANNWVKCDDGTFFNLYTPPSRADQKKRLKTEEFDLLVIGGVSKLKAAQDYHGLFPAYFAFARDDSCHREQRVQEWAWTRPCAV
jgi:hypothetical protein